MYTIEVLYYYDYVPFQSCTCDRLNRTSAGSQTRGTDQPASGCKPHLHRDTVTHCTTLHTHNMRHNLYWLLQALTWKTTYVQLSLQTQKQKNCQLINIIGKLAHRPYPLQTHHLWRTLLACSSCSFCPWRSLDTLHSWEWVGGPPCRSSASVGSWGYGTPEQTHPPIAVRGGWRYSSNRNVHITVVKPIEYTCIPVHYVMVTIC